MLPTTGRVAEVLPTSTRMRKTSVTRKQKEVKREKYNRVRVARLTVACEGPWSVGMGFSEGDAGEMLDGLDFWRRLEIKLGKAMQSVDRF